MGLTDMFQDSLNLTADQRPAAPDQEVEPPPNVPASVIGLFQPTINLMFVDCDHNPIADAGARLLGVGNRWQFNEVKFLMKFSQQWGVSIY